MKKDFRIITNNPLVREKLGQDYQVEFYECSYEDVLEKVKDEVYRGCKLLTHPLSGSVKPNETPYKSVMVSVSAGKADLMGIEIIERAIASCGKFEFKSDQYAPQVYEDFRLIDYTLISSALRLRMPGRRQMAMKYWGTLGHRFHFLEGGNYSEIRSWTHFY